MLQRKWRLFYSTLLLVTGGIAFWLLVHPKSSREWMRLYNKEKLVNSQTVVGISEEQKFAWKNDSLKLKFAKGMSVTKKWTEESFPALMRNCSYVKELFVNEFHVSLVEKNFPLAFLMTIHERPWQIVRLLATIYRPHNVYCIHVDGKASSLLVNGFRNVSACLDNVVVPEKLVEVVYKFGSSIMEAQLSCWETLMRFQTTWKWEYVINLCGTELPHLTNKEMTCTLISMEGSSVFQYSDLTEDEKRKRFHHRVEWNPLRGKLERSTHLLGSVPHNIKLYKASTYMAASHEFVQFVLTSQKAMDLRAYMKNTISPEEHFYISLYFLPEAPKGGGLTKRNIVVSKSFWDVHCSKSVRSVCILGMTELNMMRSYVQQGRTVFFFNKYLAEYDSEIMDHMQKMLISKSMHEFQSGCHQNNFTVSF